MLLVRRSVSDSRTFGLPPPPVRPIGNFPLRAGPLTQRFATAYAASASWPATVPSAFCGTFLSLLRGGLQSARLPEDRSSVPPILAPQSKLSTLFAALRHTRSLVDPQPLCRDATSPLLERITATVIHITSGYGQSRASSWRDARIFGGKVEERRSRRRSRRAWPPSLTAALEMRRWAR